jgi:hypothetical protein
VHRIPFDTDRHERLLVPGQERRDEASRYFYLTNLERHLHERGVDREGYVFFVDGRVVVVLERLDIVGALCSLGFLLSEHATLAADPYEGRRAELDGHLIEQDEPARVVEPIIQAVGRNADRAGRGALEGDGLRELQRLRHSLEVDGHFILFVDFGDLGPADRINIVRVECGRVWHKNLRL